MSFRKLKSELIAFSSLWGFGRNQVELQAVSNVLREIEETLLAGMIPTPERWDLIQKLSQPWGSLASESLNELRSTGGSLIPTLRRLRNLAEAQIASLSEARARSSQASGQALACSMLVPALGTALYFLLPTVREHGKAWFLACCSAIILTGIGALWLLHLAEVARWGGLAVKNRNWVLSSQCAGERFLALLRTGTPADIAWTGALNLLAKDSRDLALAWGYSIWESATRTKQVEGFFRVQGPAEKAILEAGNSIKKSIQVSTMEGRPCLERVETVFQALRQEMKSLVERELGLLATRALKPLFVCVAPALFGLLAFGLCLAAGDVMGDLGEF
ncbi:MAG: hypothetical protein ABIQ95_11010 [Bdellovibrionia bacterium]